jgi:hypothetical protein
MSIELPESVKFGMNFVHPVLMWVVLAIALYAFYLGSKVRRTRLAQGEEKKELVRGKYNVRHFRVGALLLAFMVLGALGGMSVTYINNGKLFVGPHLLVGLGMTGLVAVSAALSPLMQQGQNWARYTHVFLNIVLIGLFGWQAFSGIEIVQKLLSNI